MKGLKISSKIYLGFGSVLTLTIIMAIVGSVGLQRAESTFATYRKLARQTNADGRVQANMLMTRIYAKNFVIDANQSNIEGVQQRAQKTLLLIRDTKALAEADTARRVLLQDLERNLQRYLVKFEEVTELQHRRDELVADKLDILGPAAEEALTVIMTSAARDGDADAAYQAGITLRSVLLGRLYANRFLIENDDSSRARAIREFRDAEYNGLKLSEQLENPERKKLAAEVEASQRAYLEAFDEVHQTIIQRNTVIRHELDRIGSSVASRIEHLKLAIKAEQDKLGPTAEKSLTRSVIVSASVSILVIALGLITAAFIGAGISRPIHALTKSAVAMGEGDLQQPIDVDRSDEIGVLAQSIAAMRDSIIDKVSTLEREVADRRSAEKQLEETHQNLEMLVAERTAELATARDHAEHATKAKAEFLAAMSHEIRTPMNGVIGMVDLLQQTKMSRDQREMLETVRTSAYGLLTIINDILDFSKIDAGKLILESAPMSVGDIVESVTETLMPSAREKGILLQCFVDPSIPATVLGDSVRLRQVLFNLGGNAVKFTSDGHVQIRADRLPPFYQDKVYLRFQVIDTGIGISEQAQATLFEAFSQAESSTTRRFGGTGLGLTISHRLIERMGGRIEVDSREGEGAIFSVPLMLPVAIEQRAKSESYDLAGVRVLFADSDPFSCEALPAYLQDAGADVTVVSDFGLVESQVAVVSDTERAFDVVFIGSVGFEAGTEMIRSIQERLRTESVSFVLSMDSLDSSREALDQTTYVVLYPAKRSSFIRVIAVAAGRASPDIDYDELGQAPARSIAALSVKEAENASRLVLLAEDNITNQDVLLRQLNSLGFAAVVAGDGEQALKALERSSFAVLLADCHMPNLDGFGLARKIREREQKIPGRRLPIIAVTAGALSGEVEQCYEAGMDDFLSKPVETSKLHGALERWVPKGSRVNVRVIGPESSQSDEPVDLAFLADVFEGDREQVMEVLTDFVLPSKECHAEVQAAVFDHSVQGIAAGTHKLKSAVRSIGAHRLAKICEELESASESEDWSSVEELAAELKSEMSRVVEYIGFRRGEAPSALGAGR